MLPQKPAEIDHGTATVRTLPAEDAALRLPGACSLPVRGNGIGAAAPIAGIVPTPDRPTYLRGVETPDPLLDFGCVIL